VLGPSAALSRAFTVRSTDPAFVAAFAPLVASLPATGASDALVYTIAEQSDIEARYLIDCDDERIGRVPSFARVVEGIFWHLNLRIGEAPPAGHFLLHAAAVVIDGRAIVLPGASGSGKSTLATDLVTRGAAYLSDEIAAVDVEASSVEPYPKPVMLKRGSWPLFPELEPSGFPGPADPASPWAVAPESIRPGSVASAAPLGAVVFPRYDVGAADELVRLPATEAVALLSAHTFGTPPEAATYLPALAAVARTTPCYCATYGALGTIGERIRAVLG
jgi:hypothetical protein